MVAAALEIDRIAFGLKELLVERRHLFSIIEIRARLIRMSTARDADTASATCGPTRMTARKSTSRPSAPMETTVRVAAKSELGVVSED
ncbi:hypothetical protein [Methylobacterium sp. E-045]|uniref:hypothetical protein n=1 Tax=Methylobacterium sp. E-045 TaxID=2836575 RepID=UPI001FB98878|nr:hypothetical protein [Methylobacterium sp. E-045]